MGRSKREKPNPKKDQLWMGYDDFGYEVFRVLYANGTSDWDYVEPNVFYFMEAWHAKESRMNPCWQPKKRMPMEERIRLMKAYDKEEGRKTLFLGNIGP